MMIKPLGRLAALSLLAVALFGGTPGTALADCTAEALGTPPLHRARDIVFSGVIVAETVVPSDGGPPQEWDAYRMKVERVNRGDVADRVDLVPLCAPISLEVGERYIIGNAAETRRGEWLMLNDRSSIAWRLLPGNAVELQDFGVPPRRFPDHYQTPETVSDVLDLLAPGQRGSLPDTAATSVGEIRETDTAPVLALVTGLLALGFFARHKRPDYRAIARSKRPRP